MTALHDLELRHLAALDAVAAEGTFGRAALRLGYTQSAVSQQIAALERLVGAPLFDRPGGPRPVTLTPLGVVVLGHARDVLRRVRHAGDDIDRFLAGEVGRIDVGTFQSVSTALLPAIVGRLRADHPGADIRVFETDDQEDTCRALRTGEIDVAFTIGDLGPGFTSIALLDDPFVLIALPDEVGDGPYPTGRLVDQPLIGQQLCYCQIHIDNGLRNAGVEPNYVFRTNDNGAVVAMVRAGMGMSVMPLLAVDIEDPSIAVRPLDPPVPERRIQLSWAAERTRSPLAVRLTEVAEQVCAELAGRDLDAAACA